jgi:peptide/nickel transport system permease protein
LARPQNAFAIVVLLVFIVAAVFPSEFLPHSPTTQNLRGRLVPPAWSDGGGPTHLLGTDHLGRDLFSRIVSGARISMLTAATAVAIGMFFGSLMGLFAGFGLGLTDEVISRTIEIQMAFPATLLMIAIVAVFGQSITVLVLTLALASWPSYARLMRGAVLAVRSTDYVSASRALGNSELATMVRHVVPNTLSPMLVYTSFQLSEVLLAESALSFLGLGVPPPFVSWGSIIADGRAQLLTGWWVAALPGLAIVALVFALNLLGDGIRDAVDPKDAAH